MITLFPEALEKYAADHTSAEPALLRELSRETHSTMELPQMLVGPLEGAFLRLLVRLTKARRVLEVGTFTGYSALMMAEGLPATGRLITCDIDPKGTSLAQRYWARSPHGSKISLKLGPAIETIKKLNQTFDMVFIDADKENYTNYWELCLPKVRKGGLIVADNTLWSGRVLSPKDPSDQAIVAFNKHVKADRRVEAILATIRDGMMLAVKL